MVMVSQDVRGEIVRTVRGAATLILRRLRGTPDPAMAPFVAAVVVVPLLGLGRSVRGGIVPVRAGGGG